MGSSSMEELLSKQEEKEEEERKWSGGVELTLDCPVKSAWALQSDFAGLHKWVPTVRKCELVEGENKKVGCLRYCIGNSWVYERLLEFDDHNMYMSYRMESNHFVFPKGFQGYVSKVRVCLIIILPSFMSLQLPCFLKLQEICYPYCFSETAAIHEPVNLTQRKHSQIRQFFTIKCLHVFYPPVAAADSILSIYSQKWDWLMAFGIVLNTFHCSFYILLSAHKK